MILPIDLQPPLQFFTSRFPDLYFPCNILPNVKALAASRACYIKTAAVLPPESATCYSLKPYNLTDLPSSYFRQPSSPASLSFLVCTTTSSTGQQNTSQM